MSDDILYTNLSNLVTFYMGERPSADKFNAVNKYFSRGMRELAAAIGDIYDDGYPYMSTGEGLGPAWNVSDGGNRFRGLDITSLGRVIGPASNLNARMHNSWGNEIEEITETIPAGSLEYTLLHPVKDLMISIVGFSLLENEDSFTGTNQYKLLNNREILFSSELGELKDVTYSTKSNDYHGGIDYVNAGFNVIPDPNQLEKLSITYIDDRKYLIQFPKITAQQSGLTELNSSVISTENEFNNNKDYELPKWLIDSILDETGNIIPENKVIPGNFMFLKNNETQEVYKDAIYEYETPSSIIVSNIDICEEPDGGYSSQKYSLILTGTNITNCIDDLRLKWFKHDHSGKFGEAPILFESIAGKFKEIPPSGAYGPSSNNWNQMPMYLHRDGYRNDENLNNGHNAMRGDLLFGLFNYDPIDPGASITDSTTTTHSVLFGSTATYIRRINEILTIANGSGGIFLSTNEDIRGYAQNDIILTAVNSITSDCKTFIVEAENVISMHSEGIYLERSDVRNIQSYPLKTENDSIIKKAFIEATAVNHLGVNYTGSNDKFTSHHNVNEIENKTTYETADYDFYYYTGTEPTWKNYAWATGTLENTIANLYTPNWGDETRNYNEVNYTKIRFGDGLSALATLIEFGEEGIIFDDPSRAVTTATGAALLAKSGLEIGSEYWRMKDPNDLVEMEIIQSSNSIFYPTVNLKFHSEKFRVIYKIKPWIGQYHGYVSNQGFIGQIDDEDHYVHDLTWMRPSSNSSSLARGREMSFSFNRWLPWEVNVLGSTGTLNENVEYQNTFYISVLSFPYAAYVETWGGDYFPWNSSHNFNYKFDYSRLFDLHELYEIVPSISGLDYNIENTYTLNLSEIGVVNLTFDKDSIDGWRSSPRYLEIEEKIINKTLFLNIKVTKVFHAFNNFEIAMELKACHMNFVQRSILPLV